MRHRPMAAAAVAAVVGLCPPVGARAALSAYAGGAIAPPAIQLPVGAVPVLAPGVGGLPMTAGEPYRPTVPGSRARLVGGWAYAPAAAPLAIQAAVWAGNDLQASPYIYGGGHAGWIDRGYDCSGAVSYALHAGGLLDSPQASGELESWGVHGRGHWMTVYANAVHTFAVIAGLRLDTARYTTVIPAASGPRWRLGPRPLRDFVVRHVAGL